jgi:uncharacterized protein YfbU (UPF0304 family)
MMVPKTERFELRLDPSILERIDDWRAEQSDMLSRAEAVRRLVEQALGSKSEQNFVLSNQEKLVVWLLTEVLQNQKGYEHKNTLKLIQEAIYGGHFWALKWEMTGVLHNHVDRPAAVSLVVDVMDMWWFIEAAYARFTPEEKDRIVAEVGSWARDPKFAGFDGNNEGEYMSIARFLVEELGRFQDMKGRSFNSHSPRVARYGAMSARFQTMRVDLGPGRGLSVDQVIELLKLD